MRSFCFCPRLSFYHLDLQSARIYLHFKSNIILPNGAALNRFGSCAMTVVKLLTFSSILWLKSVRTANPTTHDKHEAEQVATIIHWLHQKPSLESSLDVVVTCEGSENRCASIGYVDVHVWEFGVHDEPHSEG